MRRLLLLAVLLLLYVCIYPWHFSDFAVRPWLIPLYFPRTAGDLKDFALNVWVFLPLGALLFWSFPTWKRVRWILPLLGGFALSFFIEIVQLHIPSRVSSQNDVLANTIGSALGGLIAACWKTEPGVSKWMPKGSVETFLLLIWTVFLISPLIPVHGPGALYQNIALLRQGSISPTDTFLWAVSWIVVWHLISGAFPAASRRLIVFGLLLCLLPARLFLVSRVLTKAEIAGAALALLSVLILFRTRNASPLTLSYGMIAAVTLRGLAPFQFASHAADFQWIPFQSSLASEWQTSVLILAQKVYWYGAIQWAIQRGGLGWGFAAFVTAGWLAGIEAVQLYLPQHVPEITDPLIALLCAGGFALFSRTPRRNPQS